MAGDRDRLGNVLGKFIGDRRGSSSMGIIKAFGQRFIQRYPGMGEFISRTLFGTDDKVSSIKFSLDEIRMIASQTSYGGAQGNDLISGTQGSRWPIAPLYDYLLTLDQTVGDMMNEINQIRGMGSIGSGQQKAIGSRVLFPDFRPLWYQINTELGAVDGKGLIMSEGQALGSDHIYEAALGNQGILPRYQGFAERVPAVRRKTAYELACDNALLLSYPHLNSIVALSQGLYRVNFTRALKFDDDAGELTKDSADAISPGNWINANDKQIFATGADGVTATVEDGTNANTILTAQSTDLKKYYQNRFTRERVYNGIRDVPAEVIHPDDIVDGNIAPNGGAMATLWTMAKAQREMNPVAGVDRGVPTDALTIDSDKFRRAFRAKSDHPITYCQALKEVAKELRIDLALRNLHMDMQVLFQDMWLATRRSPARAGDHHALGQRNDCPTGHVRVFRNRKGDMVPEFLSTPQGNIRNPNVVGTGSCSSIVGRGRAAGRVPNFAPALSANAMMFGDGLPGMDLFQSRTTSIGSLFGAAARRKPRKTRAAPKKKRKASKKKKKAASKKTPSRRCGSSSRKKKTTKTNRTFKGRAVFKGANGGLFTRKRSATTGKLVRTYL